MNKNLVLALGIGLIILGLTRPDFSNLELLNKPVVVDVLDLPAPQNESVKEKASAIVEIFKNHPDRKTDAKKLRDLYLDIAKLISLDSEDEVIRNTEEIRQANIIAGVMLKLDIKGKYPNLANATKDVIITAIGDDNIPLDQQLRSKAVEAFNALGWACNLGSK